MRQALLEYLNRLQDGERKSQEQFDKAVMTLSGGAFGLSFTFINRVVGEPFQAKGWLLLAWMVWGLSITAVLGSFYFSTRAHRKAVEDTQEKMKEGKVDEIYESTPGGIYSDITSILNVSGGALFLIGVLSLIYFIYQNV